MNLDFNEIWTHTPFFGKFLWAVLLFMSVWSLSVSIAKWWNLRKAQKETIKFAPEFSQFLEEDNLTEAIKLAEGYKKSHVARVLGRAGRGEAPDHGRFRHGVRHQHGGTGS